MSNYEKNTNDTLLHNLNNLLVRDRNLIQHFCFTSRKKPFK